MDGPVKSRLEKHLNLAHKALEEFYEWRSFFCTDRSDLIKVAESRVELAERAFDQMTIKYENKWCGPCNEA